MDWKLGLVSVLGALPVIVVSGLIRMRMDMNAQNRMQGFFLESARFASEAVGAIRTVTSLRLEDRSMRQYANRLTAAVARSAKQSLLYFVVFAISDSVDLLVMALIFWYGGQLLSRHELSVDSYFIIYTAIMFGGQAAGFSFGFSTSLSQSQAAANRFFYLKNSKPKINSTQGSDPRGLRDEDAAAAIVEFRNVHFRYPTRPDVTVLRDFNLQVRRGETVCLVGPSGCGKSTVISLLERFYDPSAGEILIDGAPLPSLDIKRYRAMLALVSQETSLYYGTIRENLLLGVEDGHGGGDAKATAAAQSDEGRMVEACKQASIHDFVASLPDGYATHCGPRGTALSGGQRQRLAIARALLRDPQILLLDEATSSLDAENEQLVREALERAAHGRTTVSATHHAEAMKTADRVVVMEHGRVVEEGSYEDLMAARGPLWRMHCEMELK